MKLWEILDKKEKIFTCKFCKKNFKSETGKFCPHCARFQDKTKVNEVTPKLRITPEHLRQARASKFQMVVQFPVMDFLYLTTANDKDIEDIMSTAQPTLVYNRAAKSGENILMPLLIVDQDAEKIVAHEGRHRAAALLKKGAKSMPVAIKLRPGKALDAKYPEEYDPIYKAKYEDLPKFIHGQFGRGVISSSELKPIIDGWENMK